MKSQWLAYVDYGFGMARQSLNLVQVNIWLVLLEMLEMMYQARLYGTKRNAPWNGFLPVYILYLVKSNQALLKDESERTVYVKQNI